MRVALVPLAFAVALAAAPAAAQRRGAGSGLAPGTAPPTKSAGPAEEMALGPPRDLVLLPPHGMLGAPGAAPDALGPSRLGPHRPNLVPRLGERAPAEGQAYAAWKSGDRVRSTSSADVRAARQEQAPDLEWTTTAAAGRPQLEPQTPYGVKAQQPQPKKRR